MKKLTMLLPVALLGAVAFAAMRSNKPADPTDIKFAVQHADVYATEALRTNVAQTAVRLLQSRNTRELARISEQLRHSSARSRDGDSLYAIWIDSISRYLAITAKQRYPDMEKLVQDWREASPGASHPDVAWGQAMTSYAWQARGGGYADTVSDDSFKLFHERLIAANDALTRVQSSDPENPLLWDEMLTVDRGLGTGLPGQLMHAQLARKADPYSLASACKMGGNLLPRWYGQPGEVERYVDQLALNAAPLDGDEVYCRVGISVLTYGGGTQNETHLDWARIQKGYDKIWSAHRSWDRLDSQMLMGAACFCDQGAMRNYYSHLDHGYDPTLLPEAGMLALARSLGLPPVAPEDVDLR